MRFGFIAKENGGYNDGDPPLPIPNREVKPISADDTAIPSGKVGSRQLIETFSQKCLEVFFFAKSLEISFMIFRGLFWS